VGRASAVLDGRRLLLAAALLGILLGYYEAAPHLWREGIWGDVAWLAFVLIPAVFALVGLAVPLRDVRWKLWAALIFAASAVVLTVAHADVFANFSRLGAAMFLAFWFLEFFDTLAWVLLVASIIPWVDIYSVWRGPTKSILTAHPHVFTVLSFAFPVPGRTSAANLGMPDLFFFTLFLAASARFGLRVGWTWLGLVASLGGTIALTVWWGVSGLPALPGIVLGLVVPNADLIWQRLRRDRPEIPLGGAANDA
jgi:hypothetical protein